MPIGTLRPERSVKATVGSATSGALTNDTKREHLAVMSCAVTRWVWQPESSRRRWPRHVEGYACEWRGVLQTIPTSCSRFVSFVNAPDVADPTVAFTERSGRKVPMGMPKFRPLQETT